MARLIITFGIAAAAALLSGTDAKTTVSVIEIGQGGVVRRTTSPESKTSVSAISSFWSSMHDVVNGQSRRRTRSLQYPGMTVVPDLFKRADGGLVLGVAGNSFDLASMPTVAGFLEENSAIGHFSLAGSQVLSLMEKTGSKITPANAAFVSTLDRKAKSVAQKGGKNGLQAVTVQVDDDKTAARVDAHVADLIKALQKETAETGSTIVLHLVVEEGEGSGRRLTERRLEDQEEADDDGAEEEADDSGVTPKSIFQIQYFNVVLWTAVGLTAMLFVAIGMTISMPLEPDTLLFGESAKIVGE